MNQAKPTPRSDPIAQPIKAVIAPSIIAINRKSERVIPRARTVAYSFWRTSMSIVTMVITSNIPAAIVNEPNTRNIAERTPDEASACSKASSLTARTERWISSTPINASRCCSRFVIPSPETLLKTSIERSCSSAAASLSASDILINPRMTGSNSERDDSRSSSTNEPVMVKLSESSEPKAYWNNPEAESVPLETFVRSSRRSPIRISPSPTMSVEAPPSNAKNICGRVPNPPASDRMGKRIDWMEPSSIKRCTRPGDSMHQACVEL